MSVIQKLPMGYHQQDNDIYCGAAVAQMILDKIGRGLIDQNILYNSNNSHNTLGADWCTDPDGLCYTLNAFKNNPNLFFIVSRRNTVNDSTWLIIYTLYTYNVPVAALVFSQCHWIIVHGYNTDIDPQTTTRYVLNGLYINNPDPPCSEISNRTQLLPPPHTPNDGCGIGIDRGTANEYVSFSAWKSIYHTGYDVWGVGHNEFVCVRDPSMPNPGQIISRRDVFAEGDTLIKQADVPRYLEMGLEYHNLKNDEMFNLALHNAQTTKPILVQRLDKDNTFYYLIPMKKDNKINAILMIDALYGSFLGGRVTEFKKNYIITRKYVREKVLTTIYNQRGILENLTLHKGTYCFYPIMVWKPCRESRSPFYPFYMITSGNVSFYIGYNGKIYTKLHDLTKGG